jgi:hypothetical protein
MRPTDAHRVSNSALQFLRQLIDSQYWGSVSFRLEGERGVVHIYKEQSIKPESLVEQFPTLKDKPSYAHRNASE